MFIPVFIDYLNTGLVERFPTLIVAGFMVVAALLFGVTYATYVALGGF